MLNYVNNVNDPYCPKMHHCLHNDVNDHPGQDNRFSIITYSFKIVFY